MRSVQRLPQSGFLFALSCILCGLLFSSIRANAQYPGSGGMYVPSGPPPLGWSRMLRPVTGSGSPYTSYDWTGLNYHQELIGQPGTHPPLYNDSTFYDYGKGVVEFVPANGTIGGSMAVTKQSEYHWQWTPPYYPNTTILEYTHLPARNLFVLGRAFISLSGTAYMPESHVQGQISVSGDSGAVWNDTDPSQKGFNFQGGPVTQTAQMLSRAIMSVGFGQPVAHIAPALTASGISVPTPESGVYAGGGMLNADFRSAGYPITLASSNLPYITALNAFGLPIVGDNSNKYVYDGSSTGALTLPLAARVLGGDQTDAQWVVDGNFVGWKVDPQIAGLVTYSKMASGDAIVPVTNGEVGAVVYQGLPDDDTGFGLKTVTL